MGSLIHGFEYDIFISYRQKDNKHEGWVTEFVNQLKGELESTFKEDISVYFDINPHDGLLETHDVDASLKDKLKCLIFIPIISRTYCDSKSFAWEHEFKAFIGVASKDQFGLKVKLPNGNVASRILPIQIHDLYPEDKSLLEKELGGVLRAIEFIYKEQGVNRPLTTNDDKDIIQGRLKYRNQINKVANAIDEIIHCLKGKEPVVAERKVLVDKNDFAKASEDNSNSSAVIAKKSKRWLIVALSLLLCIVGVFAIYKVVSSRDQAESVSNRNKSITVLPFANNSPDKNNEYFCNGMTDEIQTQLQNISDLRVIVFPVEKYRGKNKDYWDIGKDLNVSMILDGSISKINNDIRMVIRLIEAKSGVQLWIHPYDCKYTNEIFVIRNNIARQVAKSLNAKISSTEERVLSTLPSVNMNAYDICSQGEEMIRKFRFTKDTTYLKNALNLFNAATRLDTAYLEAIHGKNSVYGEMGNLDSVCKFSTILINRGSNTGRMFAAIGRAYMNDNKYDSAYKYLQRSIEHTVDDPWGYLILGQLESNGKNNFTKGISYFQKAYQMEGYNYSEICKNLSDQFLRIGDYERSLKYCRQAIELRTEKNLMLLYFNILALSGNHDLGTDTFLDSVSGKYSDGNFGDLLQFYSGINRMDFEKAEKYLKVLTNSGYIPSLDDKIYMACLLRETNKIDQAITLANECIQHDEYYLSKPKNLEDTFFIRTRLAAAYAIKGDKNNCYRILREIEKKGLNDYPVGIRLFPGFDYLRNDLEFNGILNRIEHNRDSVRNQVKEMELRGEIDL